jgi:hypothetical protein
MTKCLLKPISSVLVWATFATFTLADAPSAVLYASGNVTVNGKKVARSTSVFEGDSISTAVDGGGMVALNGGSVSVQAGSRVIFSRASIQVQSGSAAVKTTQKMSASVGGYEVMPLEQDSQFQVSQSGNKIHVAALRGKLAITGANMLNLDAGKTVTLECKTCSKVAEPPQAGGGNGGGTGVRTGLIIGAIATGTGIALGLALNDPQRDASPAGP